MRVLCRVKMGYGRRMEYTHHAMHEMPLEGGKMAEERGLVNMTKGLLASSLFEGRGKVNEGQIRMCLVGLCIRVRLSYNTTWSSRLCMSFDFIHFSGRELCCEVELSGEVNYTFHTTCQQIQSRLRPQGDTSQTLHLLSNI